MSQEKNPLLSAKSLPINVGEQSGMLILFEKGILDADGVKTLSDDLAEIVRNPDRFIDEGGAAKVYNLSQGACVKIMQDRTKSPAVHLMKLGNPAPVEATFLRRVSGEKIDGSCAPWCYGIFSFGGAKPLTGIIMEQLNAVNLEHALLRKKPFPKKFDPETFLNSVASYLEFLHEKMSIAHGDLFARNLMIDQETGAARIIDFGRSTDLSNLRDHKITALIQEDLKNFDVIEERLSALSLDKS